MSKFCIGIIRNNLKNTASVTQREITESIRESGIPVSSTPVVMPNYNKHGVVMPGRAYEFGDKIIRDDYLGHIFDDGGYVPRHFNDIYGNHHIW